MNVADTLVAMRTLAGDKLVRTGASAIVLVAANAGVLFLYLAYDLAIAELLTVYWGEALAIGLFCLAKTGTAAAIGDPHRGPGGRPQGAMRLLRSIGTVSLVAVQCIALFALVGFAVTEFHARFAAAGVDEALSADSRIVAGLALLLLIGHAFSFCVNFLALGEYKTARARALIALPAVRCLALAVAVAGSFAGALLAPEATAGWAFGLIVIMIKTVLDYRLHLRERRALNVL